MPLFSLVVPSYNYAAYLPRAIESVLVQAFSDWELIVVDDGSSDDTARVMQRFVRTDSRIRYIRQENAGVSVARNHGISLAKGSYILCFDADDALDSQALVHIFESISLHPRIKIHLGHHVSINEHGHHKTARMQPEFESPEKTFAAFVNRDFGIVHGAIIVAKDVYTQFGYPPGVTNGEDLVFFGHCLATHQAVRIPHALAEIYTHEGRARDNLGRIESTGLSTVDLLFDPEKLPASCLKYRNDFILRRTLSLARSYYIHGKYSDAARCYSIAFRQRPKVMTNTTHAARWVKSGMLQWVKQKKKAA